MTFLTAYICIGICFSSWYLLFTKRLGLYDIFLYDMKREMSKMNVDNKTIEFLFILFSSVVIVIMWLPIISNNKR